MNPRPLILAAAFALPASAALAVVEPGATGRLTTPEGDARDSRMRTIAHQPGQIVRLVASRGRTLVVELPDGLDITSVLTSDQDVMDGTIIEEDPRNPSRTPAAAPPAGTGGAARPCSLTANLQVCIRRERFLAIKPLTDLDPQPIHVIALRPRPNGEPESVPMIFEIETLRADHPTRVASNGAAELPQAYYAVRVTMPAPPPAPPPPRPSRPVLRRVAEPAAPPPPMPINRSYDVQGDPSLAGAVGR